MVDNKKEVVRFELRVEKRGFLFWRTNFTIYRPYSYPLGKEVVSGFSPIGRYKTIEQALTGFNKLQNGKVSKLLKLPGGLYEKDGKLS